MTSYKFLTSSEYEALEKISQFAEGHNCCLWVVGGVVRDALLGVPQRLADIDLVVDGDAAVLAEQLALEFAAEKKIFSSFLTAKVTGIPAIGAIDLASSRREHYLKPGALPEVEFGTLEEDSRRRDFTVNALYVPLLDFISSASHELRGKVRDTVAGLSDLDARLLRVLHPKSFIDDPTRLFRAVRYRMKIKGTFETETEIYFREALKVNCIRTISPQRILTEIKRACEEPSWGRVLVAFCYAGLLSAADLIVQETEDFFTAVFSCPPKLDLLEDRFDFVMGLVYHLSVDNNRQSKLRKFGFGKKFFKRFDGITKDSSNVRDLAGNALLSVLKGLTITHKCRFS